MVDNEPTARSDTMRGGQRLSITMLVITLAATAIFGALGASVGGLAIALAFLFCQVVLVSIIIWQACEPFSDAAQWIGKTLRIPGSVRGATLDAIASSLPELICGLFFVLVATGVGGDAMENGATSTAEGFGATVATCVGSAIYNMILIPAFCALFIAYYRPNRPTIDIEDRVIARDGVWYLSCVIVLILFLFQPYLYWWMALVLMGIYAAYVFLLYRHAREYRIVHELVMPHLDATTTTEKIVEALRMDGTTVSRAIVEQIRNEQFSEGEGEDEIGPAKKTADYLFGMFSVSLNSVTASCVIVVSTIVTGAACYWLVKLTHQTANQLEVPIFFVAVILAAAASSVPDTLLSIGSAKRGDDDGAVSNAFGSNIFDICVCMSIPLLVSIGMNDWKPITLTESGEPLAGIGDLCILLCVLTLITLLIMWHNRQLTRRKAIVLCALYAVFVGYAVAGSMGYTLLDLAN